MKVLRCVVGLVAGISISAQVGEIAGTWKAEMILSTSDGIPQVAYEPTFDFKVKGTELTGVARLTSWPGDAAISDGKIDSNRITFTLLHHMSYTTRGRTCYPRFRCVGTVHGNDLDLTMFHAPFDCSGIESQKWDMKGTRISR
jgi:hypothetical protein